MMAYGLEHQISDWTGLDKEYSEATLCGVNCVVSVDTVYESSNQKQATTAVATQS